jgi:hypothetical protein
MSSFFLGRGENVMREQQGVQYHSGYSKVGNPMFGKLILTSKRFVFAKQQTVEHGGFLGFGKQKELQTVSMPINILLEKVVGCQIETRTRKKGTLNAPAGMFGKEQYQVLIVGLETPDGMESPTFEVANPQDWAVAINRAIGGEAVGV